MKIYRSATEGYYTQLRTLHQVTSADYGKTATITMDINNQLDGVCSIQLNMGSLTSVNISPGEGTFTLSSEIPSGISSFYANLVFSGQRIGKLYTDNWNITIQ